MLINILTNSLLNITPKKNWNHLSHIIANLSIPFITSPINFKHNGFILKEFPIDKNQDILEKFLEFCYPINMPNRNKEIKLDQYYWKNTSTFIVFNQTGNITGCMQFISKNQHNKIPFEFADFTKPNNNHNHPLLYNASHAKHAEIYRYKSLPGKNSLSISKMLFKACWIKIIQTETEYVYLTYNYLNRQLFNLYTKKLFFMDPGIYAYFKNNPSKWHLLIKDCHLTEKKFATLNKHSFHLQTWFRKNCIKKTFTTQTIGQNQKTHVI